MKFIYDQGTIHIPYQSQYLHYKMTMKMTIVKKHFKIFLLCTTFQACFCLLLFTLTGISQQFLLTFPVQGQVPAQLISRLTSFPVSTNALNHFTWSMISPH